MDPGSFQRISEFAWQIPVSGRMRVPGVIYADEVLVREMDEKVREQLANVASLPGIVQSAYAMPDAHWGYGFPIGGVAAFDPERGGVISAGGVGFDISCGVRLLRTGLDADALRPGLGALIHELSRSIPAGVGSRGRIHLDAAGMRAMLTGGARWAVQHGFGRRADLARIEEGGCMEGADPDQVSEQAIHRQEDEMGTLGSGNHYLELQRVERVLDELACAQLGLVKDQVVISIHCGSRGLGHQIGTEFLRRMVLAAREFEIDLPDRELACAPIRSELGRAYIGAMRAAMNCAMANRQILTHLVRQVFERLGPATGLELVYDVSHNTCKEERHRVDGRERTLFVHRKGATRAFAPGHPAIPEDLRAVGQPVFIGGTMGTASYVLIGCAAAAELSFGSACHGAGRRMSRHGALKLWHGRQVIRDLAARGILVKSPSTRGVAEEAPGAYKDVDEVVHVADAVGLARAVARLVPLAVVKG